MATVTHAVSDPDTTNATSYPSLAFTPATSDLLVVFVMNQGSTTGGSMTAAANGVSTFHLAATALANGSAARIPVFVANQLTTGTASMTVTFDCAADASTGTIILVARVAGMSRTGSSAVRQSAQFDNIASGTPQLIFAAACLTGNPVLGCVGNSTNPATITPPTSFTEAADTGFATPTTGAEYVFRDSGHTSSVVTWGSAIGSQGGAVGLELDASAPTNPRRPVLIAHEAVHQAARW